MNILHAIGPKRFMLLAFMTFIGVCTYIVVVAHAGWVGFLIFAVMVAYEAFLGTLVQRIGND